MEDSSLLIKAGNLINTKTLGEEVKVQTKSGAIKLQIDDQTKSIKYVAARTGHLQTHAIPGSNKGQGKRYDINVIPLHSNKYYPEEEDLVIGTIIQRQGENYVVDINSESYGILSFYDFQGATKRDKPNFPDGTLIYCRVQKVQKYAKTSLTCISTVHKKAWNTGEAFFGQLTGGFVKEFPLGFCRKLISGGDQSNILERFGEKLQYDVTIGYNGRIWISGMDDYSSSNNEDSPSVYYKGGQRGTGYGQRRQQNADDELQHELLDRNFNQHQTYSGRGIVEERQHQQTISGQSANNNDRIQKLFSETRELQRRLMQEQQMAGSSESPDDGGNYYSQQTNQLDQRDSMNFMETQLQRAKENNIVLSRRYEQAQEEIEKSHDQIARQAQQNHSLKVQNEKLQAEIDEIVVAHQELLQRQSEDAINFERRIDHLTSELQSLKKQVIQKEDGIRSLQIANDQYKDKCMSLEQELGLKIEEIDHVTAQLRSKEDTLDKFFLNRGAESAIKLELEQLREDNKRLMKLLKQTKEYQEFANYIDDSGGNVRNLGSTEKENIRTAQIQEAMNADEDQWLPSEAYNLAHQFRNHHGNDLTPSLVNQLLNDLNKIWREREKKQISRIKQQCQQEITNLKRQLSHRVPFDELTAKKNISRLQKKLTNVKQSLQKTQQVKEKQALNPMGVELIDNTLQIIASMQVQRKELEQENSDLRDKLRKIEAVRNNQDYDKSKYMEGAVWMGKRLTNEIEKLCQKVDSVIQEYAARVSEINTSPMVTSGQYSANSFGMKQNQNDILILQRAQNWFLEALKTSSMELYEVSITMLESAIFNMEEAQSRLSEAIPNLNQSNQSIQKQLPTASFNNNSKSYNISNTYIQRNASTIKKITDIQERNSQSEIDHSSEKGSVGDAEQMFRATARFQAY